ncbi:hypothetical protein [Streptomyces sp. NPDC004976]
MWPTRILSIPRADAEGSDDAALLPAPPPPRGRRAPRAGALRTVPRGRTAEHHRAALPGPATPHACRTAAEPIGEDEESGHFPGVAVVADGRGVRPTGGTRTT